jgi:hypothetical protein
MGLGWSIAVIGDQVGNVSRNLALLGKLKKTLDPKRFHHLHRTVLLIAS